MPELIIKSEQSTTPAYVRFLNLSCRTIDIVWINFAGEFIKYKTISHKEYLDVNTFTTHPWLFIDSTTRDLMQIKNKNLFYATPVICPQTGRVGRKCVAIHLPLYSLRMNALLTVRNVLRSSVNIDSLEVPAELKNDLRKTFETQNINRYTVNTPDG